VVSRWLLLVVSISRSVDSMVVCPSVALKTACISPTKCSPSRWCSLGVWKCIVSSSAHPPMPGPPGLPGGEDGSPGKSW